MYPPLYFIKSNGRLTSAVEYFLHKSFGFSISSLQNTVWKSASEESLSWREKTWCKMTQLHGKMNASVMGRKVYYKNTARTPLEWLCLITHEQVHRHDIETHKLFYFSYILEGIYKPYKKISWEQRAYAVASLQITNQKDQLSVLVKGREHLLIDIFESDITEQEKIDKISSWF